MFCFIYLFYQDTVINSDLQGQQRFDVPPPLFLPRAFPILNSWTPPCKAPWTQEDTEH